MKYMGSKARIAKHLLPIILKDRKKGQWYVEPFVGGANMIVKVDGNRIGSDANKYLIALLDGLQNGKSESNLSVPVTLDYYNDVKKNMHRYDPFTVGYFGFLFSFGAKFFGGFIGCSGEYGCRDRIGESIRNAKKTALEICDIAFCCSTYEKLFIPERSIIYCDPPYAGTTKYKDDFDHQAFWQWCREKCSEGHHVFISEYSAPDDFVCVWQQKLGVSVARNGKHKIAIEKLFVHSSQYHHQ